MAILKHIASKSVGYGEAQRYLIFQYDEHTRKLVLEKTGRPAYEDGRERDGKEKNAQEIYHYYRDYQRELYTVRSNIDTIFY